MKRQVNASLLVALALSMSAHGCSSDNGGGGPGRSDAAAASDTGASDAEAGAPEGASEAAPDARDAAAGANDANDANDATLTDAATRDADAQAGDAAPGIEARDASVNATDAPADAMVDDATSAATQDSAADALADATAEGSRDGAPADAADASDAASDGRAFDADTDATIAPSTTAVLLDAGGTACLTCAETLSGCIATSGSCEDLVGLNATAGAHVGAPRIQLCLETLACVLRSQCTDLNAGTDLACYCGTACSGAGNPNGPCLAQELAGTETTNPVDLANLSNYYDTVRGAGRANTLVQCLAAAGCLSCFATAADH